MNVNQQTLAGPAQVSGVGLHTGVQVNLRLLPAEPNHGYKFKRVDLEGQPVVEADVDNVVDLSRGTTIEKNGARVSTIEHCLAALVGLQVDNVMIEVDGPEVPIMDGSSLPFMEAIEKAGTIDQGVKRDYFEIPEGISYSDPERNVELTALPFSDYRVTVMVDYNSPVLGSQHATLGDLENFREEIGPCRTFVFLHEIEALFKANLIKGGDVSNAIVVVDKPVTTEKLNELAKLLGRPKIEVREEGILNNMELRFKNEPARHKLLDVVGDLALVGRPLKGHILAARPGHAANIELAKKIKKYINSNRYAKIPKYDPKVPALLDVSQIYEALPHGYPFRLVDKIIHLDETSVTGVKNVTINEQFFQGHFPGNPVMPGVLQIEALAQTGGIFVLNTVDEPDQYWTYFLGLDNCKFRRIVVPGDTLVMRCELLQPIKRGIAKMSGQAFVNNQLACEVEILASIVRKEIK